MAGLQLAFKKYNVRLGIWGGQRAGFKYFVKCFNSMQFDRVVGNTI